MIKKLFKRFVLFAFLSASAIANAVSISGNFSDLLVSADNSSKLITQFPDSGVSVYQYVYVGNDADGIPISTTAYSAYYNGQLAIPNVVSLSNYSPTDPQLLFQETGYRYFTAAFKTSGLYTLSVVQGQGDPVSSIYVAKNSSLAYSSANPLTNLYVFNDDSGGISATGPWNVYYNQTSNDCTFVQFLIYEYIGDGSNLTGQFSVNGPGAIASSCATLGPPLAETQASLAATAQELRGAYVLQSAAINNNLSNDCSLFDKHGICTSVTGSQTYVSGGLGNDRTNGALTVAYRVNDKIRIGGYLDQTLHTGNSAGVNLTNGSPAFGAFAVWNANADGLGLQVRASAGYADKDMTVTRQVIGTSEAGTGKTGLNSFGAAVVGSYAFAIKNNITLSPYAGIRYTKINADAYTETGSDSVITPLTYSALTQQLTSAMLGSKVSQQLGQRTMAFASIGLEQDLNHNDGTYSATGLDGITPIAFNGNTNRTRATASVGSYYNIGERQRIAANLVWSEHAFTSINSTSLMVTYTAGF
jgi:hypothetical protein